VENNVKIHRAITGYTQQDLAEKIGVSRQTINAIESGKYVPSTVLSLKIARVFEKSMEDLFSLEGTD
jgi:putative transcriptional regulator